ncbi:MAG: radical SAM protein [Dethiobacteria bacterium]|nr:radical SAM protein [Dethiobacteria bacterium]
MKYKYLFGPVPSRRLGVSLGVDLIPLKTCSLDCVYCECGMTTRLTVDRKEYLPLAAVINELKDYLAANPRLDYITFAGSGEPTLNSRLGEVAGYLKTNYPHYKLCLLTNGTLFTDPRVRADVAPIDLVIPSLDSATESGFQLINRPQKDLSCSAMIDGLVKLGAEFKGEMRLEIFIVPGINDTPHELAALKKAIEKIKPGRVQLGTLDRPGTEAWVEAADSQKMKEISAYLNGAELIGTFQPRQKVASFKEEHSRNILQTLRRRPCTIKDLEQILDIHPAELQKYVHDLLERDKIEVDNKERGAFLKIK